MIVKSTRLINFTIFKTQKSPIKEFYGLQKRQSAFISSLTNGRVSFLSSVTHMLLINCFLRFFNCILCKKFRRVCLLWNQRDYIRKSWRHPSAFNARDRRKWEINVRNFLSLRFLSAVVPSILSQNRLSASRPWKLRPTGLEGSSFQCGLFMWNQSKSEQLVEM